MVDSSTGSILGGIGNILQAGSNIGTAASNYAMMQQQLAYQTNLQTNLFQREDTAIQRRVHDLIMAGLSPTLAAGSSANAGAPIPVNAPQFQSPDLRVNETAQMLMSLAQGEATIKNLEEQRKLIASQAKKADAESVMQNLMNQVYFFTGIHPLSSGYSGIVRDILNALGLNPKKTGGEMTPAEKASQNLRDKKQTEYKERQAIMDKILGTSPSTQMPK